MSEQRLPIVDGDDGDWGGILNQFLIKEHYNTGADSVVNGGHKMVTIRPGTTAAETAPLKFMSGNLMTTPEAGAIEFLTDRLYFTVTTGAVRRTIAAYDDASGATGDIYYRDSGGSFTRLGIGSTNDVLKVSGGLPVWSAATGGGDASTNTATSVDGEVALFSSTTGKILKRASGTGIATLTSGVLSVVTAPAGAIVGDTDTQTLTNKTISGSSNTITNVSLTAGVTGTLPITSGGTGRITGTTAYSLIATGTTATGAEQTLANGATTTVLVGGGASALPVWTTATGSGAPVRATSPSLVTPALGVATSTSINKVTITAPTTSATLTLVTGSSLITAGAFALTLTSTATTNVTLPSTGTLATLAGTETLTNKTLTTPVLSGTVTGTYTLGGTPTFPATVVLTTGAQTLSSKTLTSPIISTISNTGTLTLPISTDTLVGRDTTDTLTNKTLTSPVINTPTGIVKNDVGLGNVDNTSNATERAATRTLTSARITPRVGTTTSSATPTINTDTTDAYSITALAAAITSMTTNLSGTPTDFQKLLIRIKDNGTARAITWGASFQDGPVALPTTTVLSKTLSVGLFYDAVDSKWTAMAVGSRL